MKKILLLTIFLVLILNGLRLNAQIWPFSPLCRFSNTVYYNIDSLSEAKLKGTNIIWDKKLTNRFFDVSLKNESIGIKINDSIIYFHQKNRKEPKCYKELIFYSSRNLTNPNFKIKYLKLTNSNESELFAQSTILNRTGDKSDINKILKINKSDINGIYLGPGKRARNIFTIITIAASMTVIIILGTN